jgi:hypothetical protein
MRIKAVLDRFEDDKAVLLLGDEETAVNWPRRLLPDEAAEGHVIWLTATVDEEATSKARAEAEDLLRQLLNRDR